MQLNCVNFITMGIIRRTKSVKEILHLFENKNEAISVVHLIELMNKKMN